MSHIERVRVSVTTTGNAGSATGSADTEAVNGFYLGAYLNYHASAPGTTDVTISTQNPSNGNLQVISNANTDAFVSCLNQAQDAAGAAITASFVQRPVSGNVRVALAQCDALTDALVADLYFLIP